MSKATELYKARKEYEEQGVTCEFLGGDIRIRAASPRNKEFIRLSKGLSSGEHIKDDDQFRKLAIVVSEAIASEWDEESYGGEYSPEAFVGLCEELREHGFLEDVIAAAMDREMFNKVAAAKVAKN